MFLWKTPSDSHLTLSEMYFHHFSILCKVGPVEIGAKVVVLSGEKYWKHLRIHPFLEIINLNGWYLSCREEFKVRHPPYKPIKSLSVLTA